MAKEFDRDGFIAAMKALEEREKAKRELLRTCSHDWQDDFDFVYDYRHQTCTKCGSKRMS